MGEDQIYEKYFGDLNDFIYISYKSLYCKVLLHHIFSFVWGKYLGMGSLREHRSVYSCSNWEAQ